MKPKRRFCILVSLVFLTSTNVLASHLPVKSNSERGLFQNTFAEESSKTAEKILLNADKQGEAGMYPIVHTGVSAFYTANTQINTPDSSDIQFWQDAGRKTNAPSYTDNGDNTITDNVTGLMWQKEMCEKLSWEEALVKLQTLNQGEYADWRIPTIKELYSLILFTGRVMGEKAITAFIDTNYFIQPLGDTNAGERSIDAQVWSSTFYRGLTMNSDTTIFGVNFIDGRIKGYPKIKKRTGDANRMYFRMVRGNELYGKNLFKNNNNGTVTDSATHLMWQKADDGVARDWLSSIQYCENLELAGYKDWHLPNAKELQSIVEYNRSPSATYSAAIDTVFMVSEIEDPEGRPGHFPYFWSSTTHADGPNPNDAAVYLAFGEALGKMNGTVLDVHGAGAQRSDPKTGNPSDYPKFHGPQGDVQMVYNHCRCVREVKETATSTNETGRNSIKIFPNPANDKISVFWSESRVNSSELRIYTLSGTLIFRKSLHQPINEIDISNLSKGVYFLLIDFGSKHITKKMVKT